LRKILITLVISEKSIDLEVPGEIPIGELILNLCEILCFQSLDTPPGDSLLWGLGLLNADSPLDVSCSLSDYGVVDGTALLLQDMNSWERQVHHKLQHAYEPLTFSTNTFGNEFHRISRDYTKSLSSLSQGEVVISPPPLFQPIQNLASIWPQVFIPLVVSLSSFIFIIIYHTNPLVVVTAISLIILSFSLGLIVRYQQRQTIKKRYKSYLNKLREEVSKAAQLQRAVINYLYPSSSQLIEIIMQRDCEQQRLWERQPEDQDFLHVRVGLGSTRFCKPMRLDLGAVPMIQYDPELLSDAEALIDEHELLINTPIGIGLATIGTLSITGNAQSSHALLRSLLCQLATFHSPEDVRFVAYFPSQEMKEWSRLKWFPHMRRLYQVKQMKQQALESICMMADNVDNFRELLDEQITPELRRRYQLSEDRIESAADLMKPHIVLILDGFSQDGEIAQLSTIVQLFQDPRLNGIDLVKHGLTVICLVDSIRQEPSNIKARLTINDTDNFTFQRTEAGESRLEGIAVEGATLRACEEIARYLAPLKLADKDTKLDLSQDVTLFDLLSISSAAEIQTRETWQRRAQQDILRVPIGRCTNGTPLMLDLKEAGVKGMGPHGLLVGSTGSGKSELLRTLVISLAITHDPNIVNFVLLDFKGGEPFADIAALPHVKGIITNLENDLTLIDRVYSSLLGEQQYRQKLLRETGNLDNIRQYQTKQQMNPAMAPMPYLLIIVDEFAKLIASKQEFLELFVGIGQIGRSLGMHLLLATQRLEEGRLKGLETYLSYRICLRTFSASESMAVLEKPDAFHLPLTPGIGYFKVGTTIYSLFKSAIITSPYISEAEKTKPSTVIREFTPTGQLVSCASIPTRPVAALSAKTEDEQTEMDVVIRRLAKAQVQPSSSSMHRVWLPPLEKNITLDAILKQVNHGDLDGSSWPTTPPFGPLKIPIGLVDKPLEQVQEPLMLDFSGASGHLAIVGSPQSGKSTLLRTIFASFIVAHSPRDTQLYGIDLGGGLLQEFEKAPHVGSIFNRTKREKIHLLIRKMRTIIEERVILFQELQIDSMVTYRLRRQNGEFSKVPFGDVFLIIDNFAQLQRDFDQLDAEILEIVSNGLNYGVHVIVAINRWSELPPKLRQNFGTRLELHLHDPLESELGKAVAAALPASLPGRGLTRDRCYFQTALPYVSGMVGSSLGVPIQTALKDLVQRAQRSWQGAGAPQVRVLPSSVKWHDLPQPRGNQPSGVPIGLDEFQLAPVYIDLISTADPHFLIFGDRESGKTNLLRLWMRGLEQRYSSDQVQFAILDYRGNLLDLAGSTHLFAYQYTKSTTEESLRRLKDILDKRLQASVPVSLEQFANTPKWTGPHYFLFVDDYDTLVSLSSNPLIPIGELLFSARDIGFHLILALRTAGSVIRANLDPIVKRLKDAQSPGLIMSGDPQEGYILGTQRANPLPPGRGYLIRRKHPPTLIQVAFAETISSFVEANNPYVVGRPVGGTSFVGRRDIMKMIQENIKPSAGKNILVLRGQRRTGKTSVLLRVHKTLAKETNGAFLPVFVDLEGLADVKNEGQFFHLLADQIRLDLIPHGLNIGVPSPYDFEQAPTSTFKNKFLQKITEALDTQQILLMLDEFEILKGLIDQGRVSNEILRFCRHLMQHSPLLFLIAGAHKLRELTDEYWSVFFNLAVPIDIGTLSEPETEWLITEPIRYWYTLETTAIHEIVQIAGCHPYFTQMICMKLLEVRNEAKLNTMTVAHVHEAVNRTLRSGEENIGYPWTERDCTSNERLVLSVVANQGVNSELVTVDIIRQQLEEKEIVTIGPATNRLRERGVVQINSEGRVSFVVPLFQQWIVRKRYHILEEAMRYNEEH